MEDFVTYKQAVKLKELGFEWECNHYYNKQEQLEQVVTSNHDNYYNCNNTEFEDGIISAPTLAQAQKWLREIKNIYLFVTIENSEYYWYIDKDFSIGNFKTYEQALSAGIDKVLEIIE